MGNQKGKRDRRSATLYVVSTPIGNLEDITFRAIQVLKSVELIAAESVQHTRGLCRRFAVTTKLTSYNQHNRKTKAPALSPPKPNTPIRFQISAPEGGEVERALGDILASVPEALRSGISIGALFRQVMIENDEEIAKMIRKSVGG